jgi:hypothetical protein
VAENIGLVKRINNVFGNLGKMITDPVKIVLKQNAIPYAVTTPRRIALPLYAKVKEEIERMENIGVISKITEPTDWCAPMVPVWHNIRVKTSPMYFTI